MSRSWENWDVPGVVEKIQHVWQSAEGEARHRTQLADLVLARCASPGASVLEVGCGTGLVYQQLMAKSDHAIVYTGVDLSLDMLRKAREDFPEGRFLYGDGNELVFRDAEIDLVLCLEMLGHIGDIVPVVREMLRAAKLKCIFTVWPAAGDAIVEKSEEFEGAMFLHREYPDSYVRDVIAGARAAGRIASITTEPLESTGLAYIIEMKS